MKFVRDTMTIDGTSKRPSDGALIVDARAARTGIQTYTGFEVGRPELSVVRVFRGADEVFATDSLKSFAHRPITDDHPREMVDATNWSQVAKGQTSDEVTAEQIYVRVPLMVSDHAAISKIESGKRELSVGYTCDLDWTPGTTQSGETYDARQTNIRVNHIAIVDRGRAGKECRIGDSWIPDKDTPTMTTKIITVDGLPVETTDAGAAAITLLQGKIATLISDNAAAVTRATTDLATRDTRIGELTVQLADASKPVDIDALVASRMGVVDAARSIVPDLVVTGLTDAAIRRAVALKKLGEDIVKDASDDVVTGMFLTITKDAKKPDAFADALGGAPRQVVKDNGQTAYEQRLQDAWKQPAATA